MKVFIRRARDGLDSKYVPRKNKNKISSVGEEGRQRKLSLNMSFKIQNQHFLRLHISLLAFAQI